VREHNIAWLAHAALLSASEESTTPEPYYDFVPLRETPLIEARPGDLICPALPFLLAKIVDEPYFILSGHLQNSQEFQQAFGRAYEESGRRARISARRAFPHVPMCLDARHDHGYTAVA
jgi:hypothetical protein